MRHGAVAHAPELSGLRGLVHKEELERLAGGGRAGQDGDPAREVAAWRQALELLPPSRVSTRRSPRRWRRSPARLEEVRTTLAGGHRVGERGAGWRWAGLGGIGLLAWKLKAVLLFVLTKGKLLALGLTKSGTTLSMLFAFGVYWTAFGWPSRRA